MNRSDTEPRRIGVGSASSLASLRTTVGIGSRGIIFISYGYYAVGDEFAKLLHPARSELPHTDDVRPGRKRNLLSKEDFVTTASGSFS